MLLNIKPILINSTHIALYETFFCICPNIHLHNSTKISKYFRKFFSKNCLPQMRRQHAKHKSGSCALLYIKLKPDSLADSGKSDYLFWGNSITNGRIWTGKNYERGYTETENKRLQGKKLWEKFQRRNKCHYYTTSALLGSRVFTVKISNKESFTICLKWGEIFSCSMSAQGVMLAKEKEEHVPSFL